MADEFKACCVDECKRRVSVRGFCNLHYCRVKRYGHPLAGRTLVGEPKRYFSEVAIPYEGDECLIWPYARDNLGYARLNDGTRMKSASRIMCEKTIGPPPTDSHHAAHSCGNGHLGCIAKSHLRWATVSENQADRVGHGTSNRGERSASSKIREQDVLFIRESRGKIRQKELAKMFGIDSSTVSNIQNRKLWAWLP